MAHILAQLHHTPKVLPDVLDVGVFAPAMAVKRAFLVSSDSLTTSLFSFQ